MDWILALGVLLTVSAVHAQTVQDNVLEPSDHGFAEVDVPAPPARRPWWGVRPTARPMALDTSRGATLRKDSPAGRKIQPASYHAMSDDGATIPDSGAMPPAAMIYPDEGAIYEGEMGPGAETGACGCGSPGGCSSAGGCGPWGSCFDGGVLFPLCGMRTRDRLYVRGEYLYWWAKGDDTPPLVTTSPTGTVQNEAGVLGEDDTSILFGGSGLGDKGRSGGRVTLGYWLNPCHSAAVEFSYFGLGEQSTEFYEDSNGSPILARPYFDLLTGDNGSQLTAFPGVAVGSIDVTQTSEFQNVEVLLRKPLLNGCGTRLDFLAGWRYGRLRESIVIQDSLESVGTDSGFAPGSQIDLIDEFETENEFNGAELGFSAEIKRCRWSLELLTKMAIGSTNSTVRIDGSTVATVPGSATTTADGGYLALPSNIGTYSENHFTVVPEFGARLYYDLACNLRASVGYTFIYWSQVARPGDQMNLDVNPSQFPNAGPLTGPARPTSRFTTSDFWAQGLSFGLTYDF